MAFFKSFQQNLPSVSSLLDSVSTTVSSAMDDLSSAVSDVTYTVSDQLTEQVNTIISKVQTDEDDKKNETEVSSAENIQTDKRSNKQKETEAYGSELGNDGEVRKSRKLKKNSLWSMDVDADEIMREKERQEEARRAEEEEWEWCYAPNKGWYRIRKEPNQPQNASQSIDNQKGNCNQTSKKEPVAFERCNNEGNNHNENINCMLSSKSVDPKFEENAEHIVEEESPERPEISMQDTGIRKKENEDEEDKTPSSSPRKEDNEDSLRDGDPERGLSESEDMRKNKYSQQQISGFKIRDSNNAKNKDCSNEASPKQVKRKNSSLNELHPPPYQDKEVVKHGSQGCSDSADGSGSEVSECSEDTEGYLHRADQEDPPSNSTAILDPEVRTSCRRFPRCHLL